MFGLYYWSILFIEKEGSEYEGCDQKKFPEIVLKNGKPSAVILNINVYQEMLEQLEDIEDLRMLEDMRKKPLKFRKLDDFLKEYNPGV